MPEQEIKSLHGRFFAAEICFTDVVGRVSYGDDNILYLCHDNHVVGIKPEACKEMFGYKYAWPTFFIEKKLADDSVQNLKILPTPLEYHELFKLILDHRESTWDVDGSYSVLPKDVLAKIADFMDGMKNLGK